MLSATTRWFCTLVLSAGLVATVDAQRPSPVTVYVGPQIRDGFVDIDRGVLDSIKDTQDELKGKKQLRVVKTSAEATLHLYIVKRYPGAYAGNVAVPLATGGAVSVPMNGHVVEAMLKFGDYEKPLIAEERNYGVWQACAIMLAKDVAAWVDANRAKLP
jgi:hypothetical protein